MKETSFLELAELCRRLEATTKRLEKIRLIGDFLLELEEKEIPPAVHLIIGKVFSDADKKTLDIGWRIVSKVVGKGRQVALVQGPLTILKVQDFFNQIASAKGKDSRKRKENLLQGMLSLATPEEAKYIIGNIFGEMRLGVSEGIMLEAVAKAARVDLELLRRAHMFSGDIGEVAKVALAHGSEGLKEMGIKLFTPIKPMLAEMSYSLGEVFEEHGGRTALEYKYDGARIQIHKRGDEVKIFSRRLSDVTTSLPEIVELVQRGAKAEEILLDGEVVAVDKEGRPLPFQDLMRRFKRIHDIEGLKSAIPIKLYLFDVLYLNGKPLIDYTYEERWDILSKICSKDILARRIISTNTGEAEGFLNRALEAGHEGLMAKALSSDYSPGKRGKKWFKIKPAEHLDLVIIGAEWGHGRRKGWLSNYYLAVKDESRDEFAMVGKTFKGLTDEEFEVMTKRLQEIKISESEYAVHVVPKIVVEVAYNEIQKSPHYKSGFALRFARITRIREDKDPEDADTLARLKELYEKQFEHKGKLDVEF